jgi:8-oxo-dGTP pyrophosphatase MutT (NUDIX family)
MSIIAREVEFARRAPVEVYHAVEQADYIAIVAMTPSGKIPIVQQFRPALEDFAWELPAGLVEPGEKPIDCARRELLEETGFSTRVIHELGVASPCTGRLNNRIHSFFVETGERSVEFRPEPGLRMRLVAPSEISRLIVGGTFVSQLHIGTLLLAQLHGFLALPPAGSKKARRPETT